MSDVRERFVNRLLNAPPLLAAILLMAAGSAASQSMDEMNLQMHGYATQGFIYTTHNNILTTNSSDGSPAWTEAVVNVSAQPSPKLHVIVQARYFLLGDYGNAITLDFASADYKVNDRFGMRFGKVKTPSGLFNEVQDIDPSYMWSLLPQGTYPIASRNSLLAHYGGVLYGAIPLGERAGKLDYRAYAGDRVIDPEDGYFQAFKDYGLTMTNPLTMPVFGGKVDWRTPLTGLDVGASESAEQTSGSFLYGQIPGRFNTPRFFVPDFFGKYERNKLMVSGEYSRVSLHSILNFTGLYQTTTLIDQRAFYAMASYRLATRLTGGLYYSSAIDKQAAFTSGRYQKDWALSARYDFNPFLYLKCEQHFMDGTRFGYSTSDNAGGLTPDTGMTIFKVGVSF
jgi:hypothetical protein